MTLAHPLKLTLALWLGKPTLTAMQDSQYCMLQHYDFPEFEPRGTSPNHDEHIPKWWHTTCGSSCIKESIKMHWSVQLAIIKAFLTFPENIEYDIWTNIIVQPRQESLVSLEDKHMTVYKICKTSQSLDMKIIVSKQIWMPTRALYPAAANHSISHTIGYCHRVVRLMILCFVKSDLLSEHGLICQYCAVH